MCYLTENNHNKQTMVMSKHFDNDIMTRFAIFHPVYWGKIPTKLRPIDYESYFCLYISPIRFKCCITFS